MAAKEKSSSRLSAWLAPLLLLAAVAVAVPASVSMAGALETRAWEKTSFPLELRQLESLQLLDLHQQNESGGYDCALGSPLAAKNAGGELPGTTPVGRSSSPINFPNGPATNSPATINGVDYSGHAIDSMMADGVPPSVVQNAIQNGTPMVGKEAGTAAFYDPANNVTVITNSTTGKVVTVSRGLIKQ